MREVIRGHQRQSDLIQHYSNGARRQSDLMREVIRGDQRQSVAIRPDTALVEWSEKPPIE